MNKILDQLVEDKYGYSMRDSDSSTYEKTAGWEKEYVNGFMEEAKSGKYDFKDRGACRFKECETDDGTYV